MLLSGTELQDTSPEKYCELELSGRIESSTKFMRGAS